MPFGAGARRCARRSSVAAVRLTMSARTKSLNHRAGADSGAAGANADASLVPTLMWPHRSLRLKIVAVKVLAAASRSPPERRLPYLLPPPIRPSAPPPPPAPPHLT